MNVQNAASRWRRITIPFVAALCVVVSLLALSATLKPTKAGAICDPRYLLHGAHRYCNALHTNFQAYGDDFSLYGGGPLAKGYTFHVNGGFVRTCWLMRSDAYSRVRMAAQLVDGRNKQTVEKIIDNNWRLYCDAATAKTHNYEDMQGWLRLLDGYPVRVRQASAETLTQGIGPS
jgi:hypothetical protein